MYILKIKWRNKKKKRGREREKFTLDLLLNYGFAISAIKNVL